MAVSTFHLDVVSAESSLFSGEVQKIHMDGE